MDEPRLAAVPPDDGTPLDPPAGFFPLRLQLLPGGLSLELTKPNQLLGRHSQADLRLPLPDVSRRHCRLVFEAGGWHVVDLESLNGVYVNGERVRESALRPGDRLRIGGFTFAVELALVVEPPTAAQGDEVRPGVLRSIVEALPHRRAS
jgi:predicted component of type VI protein secretion system